MRHLPFCTAVVLALSSLSVGAPVAHADPIFVQEPVTFDAVDEVDGARNTLFITGVVAGEKATYQFNLSTGSNTTDAPARCERMALLAMNKPGKYLLTVTNPAAFEVARCKLTLVSP